MSTNEAPAQPANGTPAPAVQAGANHDTNAGTRPVYDPSGNVVRREPIPAPDKPDVETVSMPSEAFKERLAKEASSAQRKMLKELGFEKTEDLQATLKALRGIEEASLSEQEKLKRRNKELEPKEAEAKELSEALSALVEDQFQQLPEKVRDAIDEVAKGNARDRLRLMKVMKAAGVGASAPIENGAPHPAGPANRAAAGGPPPAPSGGVSKFAEWQQLRAANPSGASIFFQMHKAAIEASRPADQ